MELHTVCGRSRLVCCTPARLASRAFTPALALAFGFLFLTIANAQTTIAADTVADSVGVNVHLHYDGTIYREDFPTIKSRLIELAVRHVRDGLIDTQWLDYYDRHKQLGQAGIKGIFITSPGVSTATLQDYPARMAGAFEGFEAPNEYNWSGDPAWVTTLRATLTQLHSLKSIPAIAGYPVYGPSLTEQSAYAALGDITALVDAGNLHNYLDGRNPGTGGWGANGYGSIDWHLQNINPYIGGKPIVTTETGYSDDTVLASALPREMSAKYLPRVALEQLRKGISRTYLYELCDFPTPGLAYTSGFGLLQSDGTTKPAFTALKGLLTLVSDPGPAFVVQPLSYSLQGASSDVRQMVLQKRNGTYYLAIWIELPGYDVGAGTATAVPTQAVTLTLPANMHAVIGHQWAAGGQVVHTNLPPQSASVPITVSDSLLLLEIRNTPPSAPTNVRTTRTF